MGLGFFYDEHSGTEVDNGFAHFGPFDFLIERAFFDVLNKVIPIDAPFAGGGSRDNPLDGSNVGMILGLGHGSFSIAKVEFPCPDELFFLRFC